MSKMKKHEDVFVAQAGVVVQYAGHPARNMMLAALRIMAEVFVDSTCVDEAADCYQRANQRYRIEIGSLYGDRWQGENYEKLLREEHVKCVENLLKRIFGEDWAHSTKETINA